VHKNCCVFDVQHLMRAPSERKGVAGRRRALVIDDDAAIRVLVARVLERNDFEVEVARDGAEGIEKLAAAEFSVIILDLMMPRLDGFAVVRYLSQYCPEKLASVIVTTAYGASATEKVCPPIVHFLEKPFDVASLVEHVSECCAP
jgi:two-component system, response regulator, stage 0 sporulation protein F